MGRTVILDNGHGGMINNQYQTPGKRSPNWHKGVLYEGMFNRWVVNRMIERLDRKKIPYYHVSPELSDVSLVTRCNRADKIFDSNPNVWLFSIHANAGGGSGIEGFTTIGRTISDHIGDLVLANLDADMKNINMRFDWTDGDRDKEDNYHLLINTKASAFILECGFMDYVIDYNNLWDEIYLGSLVDSLVKSIEEVFNQ